MASLIRNNNNINGITIGEYERKLVQFADDTSCILADIESVENLFDSLKYFSKFSGLKLNIEKKAPFSGLGLGEKQTYLKHFKLQ